MFHSELPVPESDYQIFGRYKVFCILADPENPFCKTTQLETSIQLQVYEDENFFEREVEPNQPVKSTQFYDVRYIRDTRLKDILRPEWQLMWGPQDIETFLEVHPKIKPSTPVKVFCLEKVKHDLRQLNRQYLNPSKFGR